MKFLEKLETRERLYVLGFGIFLIVILFGQGLRMLYSLRQGIAEEANSNAEILQRLQILRSRIMRLAPAQDLPGRAKAFAQVNEIMQQNQLNPIRINEKKGKNQSFRVDVRLQSVEIENFFGFLYNVEYQSQIPFAITALRLQRAHTKKELYDISFTVSMTIN